MSIFKKDEQKEKNKKLTSDIIRIKINRLINGTPVEIAIFDAKLMRDKNNNTIILNEPNNFKEEMPGIQDSLISDILYKLESRSLNIEQQLTKVTTALEKQEEIIASEDKGYYLNDKKEKITINIQTEKTKLRLLKCVKYTLDNKKGEGFFESIEIDGTRSLSYLVRDGDLIPYWCKTPDSNGEPVILVPDIVQRKKFYREASEEVIADFNENNQNLFGGWLGFFTKALYVVLFLVLIVWTIHNARWSGDLYDESLMPEIQKLQLENQKVKQQCINQIAGQIETNDVMINYAKKLLTDEMKQETVITDKSNIKI